MGRPKTTEHGPSTIGRRKLFSRDLNYLRDLALFWPFFFSSFVAVVTVFSPTLRRLELKCAAVAVVTLLLAREKLVLLFMGMAFLLIHAVLALILQPWSWTIFALAVLTGVPILILNRFWRNPKFTYEFPDEPRLVDLLWSVASICITFSFFWVISK